MNRDAAEGFEQRQSEPTVAGSELDSPWERAVVQALRRPAVVQIPSEFAGQVARLAVAEAPPLRLFGAGWGPRMSVISGLVLTAAMFAYAPHATPRLRDGGFLAEVLLCAELGTVALFSPRLLRPE